MKHMVLLLAFGLSACGTSDVFNPKSEYPPDPWVKGYADDNDCLGGEALAARRFELPEYPRRSYNSGRQGWVIVRLDVSAAGYTQNVEVERSVPDGLFETAAVSAVEKWTFDPPKDGYMQNCRVLLRFRAGTVSLGG